MELIGCLDDDEGRAGDQVVGLEQAVDGRFRDEVALRVGERHCKFAWRQLRLIQGQLYDLAADIVRDTVPHPAGTAIAIFKTGLVKGSIAIVPAIECGRRNTQLVQAAPDRQMGALDQAHDLQLLGWGIPHSPSPPSPIMLFFEQPVLQHLFGKRLLEVAHLVAQLLDLTRGRLARGIARKPFLASLKELFRPANGMDGSPSTASG